MTPMMLIYGGLVGLSLGLTGGGGAIFAVPLLVYGAGLPAHDAVATSLAAVGATAAAGFLRRWGQGQVELRTGLLFAVAGMLGAPVGAALSRRLPAGLLLFAFAVLMVVVAARMWSKARATPAKASDCAPGGDPDDKDGPTCRRDASGTLLLNTRCARLLLLVGLGTGLFTGLFGVGGGFIIVPALVLFSGMSIHRAVGTSLMVIALVSVSGLASHLLAGRDIAPLPTALFVLGGIGGMLIGQHVGTRLPAATMQKVFAAAILLVAAFVLFRAGMG